MALHPSVQWAQRSNCVFLTILLEDCKDPNIKIEQNNILFKGVGGADKKEYECNIDLYEPVDTTNSAHSARDRCIEFCLKKEKDGPYWPRLTKSQQKHHWLKVDFNKWKDEDESDDENPRGPGGDGGGGGGGGPDFEEMMRQMGGLGGAGGMGGMGGMEGFGGDKPNLDDLDKDETDSDDEDLPDLE